MTQIKEFGTVEKVSLFVVITVILGVVLQLLNRPLIRLLEGYSLPSFMKREGERKRYRKWKEKERCGDDTAEWYIPKYFPDQENLLLRTRLGNAIRAYEYYPYKVYNIDPIPTWARLLTVVPKDYFSRIDASESGLDFFVNCTALFLLAGLEVLAAMLLSRNAYLAILSAICFVAMPLSYSNAVEQAVARGSVFKSCFDSYRMDLLKKMGFALPTSINEEREIWGKISLTFLFLIPPTYPI